MRSFVFRAQVALDLRRKRDDEAKRQLAEANAAVAQAELALDASRERHARALDDARLAQASATDTTTHVWYRNWISIQQQDVTRRHQDLERRCDEAQVARDRATRTHVDVRVLEKLKDRARRTYDQAVAREEQKAIDWLAVLRSLPRASGQEGFK